MRRLIVLALMGAILLLSACGQKGDLYLPDNPSRGVDEKAGR